MAMLAKFMRYLGMLVGFSAFALALGSALLAGVDPFWAVIRAILSFTAVVIAYSALCKALVYLMGLFEVKPADTSDEQENDNKLAA